MASTNNSAARDRSPASSLTVVGDPTASTSEKHKEASSEAAGPTEKKRRWRIPRRNKEIPPPAANTVEDAPLIPDVTASLLSSWTYWWMTPLLTTGYRRPLERADLWKLTPDREAGFMGQELVKNFERRLAKAEAWNKKLDSGEIEPSGMRRTWWKFKSKVLNLGQPDGRQRAGLAGAISDTFFVRFWSAGALKVVADMLQVTAPLVTKALIQFGSRAYYARRGVPGVTEDPIGRGIGLAIGLWLMLVVAALCIHGFFARSAGTGVLARGALIAALYRQAVKLSGKSRTTITNSQLVNHISTDISRVDFCLGFAHMAWTAPLQLIVIIVILIVNIGYSAIPGIAFVFIIGPIQTRTMLAMYKLRKKAMVHTDARAKLTQELLGGVKVIKFFAWEGPYVDKLSEIRRKELVITRKLLILRALNMAVALSVPLVASIVSFSVYSLTANRGPDAPVIFTALTLFNLIRMPLMILPLALSSLTDAKNALNRLRTVFVAETVDYTYNIDADSKYAVYVDHASFQFESRPEEPAGKKKKGGRKSLADLKRPKLAAKQDKPKPKRNWMLRRKNTITPDTPSTAIAGRGAQLDAEAEDREVRTDGTNAAVDGQVVDKADLDVDGTDTPAEVAPFQLRDISLSIPHGQLCAIVGPVGSGKSALLNALIGEMRRLNGTVKFGGRIGYCAQQAWIQNATLQENILFGREMDNERYEQVIKDSCLEADLDMLPYGDQTQIGEKGITLSGGQKQRVNIARALYFDADILCFDDPLSAVDAHVGKHLFEHAIKTALAGKTRILVTHALHFLPQVDYIYCLEQGRITESGTYTELQERKGAFSRLVDEFGGEEAQEQEKEEAEEQDAIDGDKATKEVKSDKHVLIQEEERAKGSVSLTAYGKFFKAAKGKYTIPALVSALILSQAAQVTSTYTLVWWQENTFNTSQSVYMGMYAGIGLATAVFTFLMGVAAVIMGNNASNALHAGAIRGVMEAPSSFFDTTPIGRIMTRFSKDIDVLDNTLNDSARMALSTLGSVAGAIVLIAIVQQWFLLVVAVILFAYYYAAKFYRASAREIKRLDNLLRSALYAHFAESLTGLASIRAYGETKRFIHENERLLDVENRAYYLTVINQRWLGLRLDFFGSVLVFAVAIISVGTRYSLSPSEIGVALSYIISVQQAFSWMVRQIAEVENDMNSCERLIFYTDSLEREAPRRIAASEPPASWPHEGAISFNKVVMAYRPGLPPVLKGLSLDIRAGEKIGIVGRTGAGKSSIMISLVRPPGCDDEDSLELAQFRMVELTSGNVSIDGVDISKIGLETLRSRMALIPQDPLLFQGTIRSNLDPFHAYDDARLWDALRRAWLVDRADGVNKVATVGGRKSGETQNRFSLDTVVEDEGLNLSVGERSLVSLARASVKDARIVLLDEATASVDYETDARIQRTIATEFKDKTLLTIAHRLLTIISYDRILVMDHGEMSEFDTPATLFQQRGIFHGMCERSNISLADIERARAAREAGQTVVIRADEEDVEGGPTSGSS